VIAALERFGAPLGAHSVTVDDFRRAGIVYQLGLPPRRIGLLTEISGVTFEEASAGAIAVRGSGLDLPVIGRAALLKNERATGRRRDEADVEALEANGAES